MNIQPKDTSRGHFFVSLAKSCVRVAAGITLIMSPLSSYSGEFIIATGILLIIAEALGVVEELV